MARKPKPRPRQLNVTHYHDSSGKRCSKSTPGAVARKVKTESYYAQLPDGKGGYERVPLGVTDLGEAWRELSALLEHRAKEAAGIIDPTLAHAAKPLGEHISDWIAQLRAGGRTSADQLQQLQSRVGKLASLAGWERLGQLDRDSAIKALARLQQERTSNIGAEYQGRSNQTRNHYLSHLKQFCTWLVEEGRLARSLVAGIDRVNVEVDLRHARRSPSTAEVALLMAYLEGQLILDGASGPIVPAVRCRMSGPHRGLGLRVCMATGFRAGELRSLQPGSFDLERGTVTCRAKVGKNRRLVILPLPDWLVAELREWFASGGGCWSDFPENWPGRLLLADQEACGIAHVIEGAEGKLFFDFHSLRHWYVSFLGNHPGISPKTLMTLARHSDPELTLKRYGHGQADAERAAVNHIPQLGPTRPRPAANDPGPG